MPIIIDVEASGFGRDSYPIEVGYAMDDGSSFCTLIQPLPEWTHWDPAAEQVHRIERELLTRHGRPVAEVAELLNDQLHGRTVFSDGWAHDFTWLAVLYECAGRRQSFKLESLRKLLSEADLAVWDAAKRQVHSENNLQRHRASSDARLLQMTWQRVQQRELA